MPLKIWPLIWSLEEKFIFQLSGEVCEAEFVFYPTQSGGGFVSSAPELVSVYHSHSFGDWRFFCLSFIPPFSACFFVWFKSAHSLSKSAHKGQGSVCHVRPFPVCLIDQSGIFSWHSPRPQPSQAPKRHQTLVEFALLHVSPAVLLPWWTTLWLLQAGKQWRRTSL